jgi:hypothetical protein
MSVVPKCEDSGVAASYGRKPTTNINHCKAMRALRVLTILSPGQGETTAGIRHTAGMTDCRMGGCYDPDDC